MHNFDKGFDRYTFYNANNCILQTEDFEKKKLICKCLRYVAHSKLANLLFVSSKSESLVSKARASISSMVFGTSCRYVSLICPINNILRALPVLHVRKIGYSRTNILFKLLHHWSFFSPYLRSLTMVTKEK